MSLSAQWMMMMSLNDCLQLSMALHQSSPDPGPLSISLVHSCTWVSPHHNARDSSVLPLSLQETSAFGTIATAGPSCPSDGMEIIRTTTRLLSDFQACQCNNDVVHAATQLEFTTGHVKGTTFRRATPGRVESNTTSYLP